MSELKRPNRLVLIRHAQSERNKAKEGSVYFADDEARQKVRGTPDYLIPLTPEGHDQARQTGEELVRLFGPPGYVYHSGYKRTRQTLEDILTAYAPAVRSKIKVRMNPFIRERDAGYAYDMTTEEAEAAFPWLKEHWDTFGAFFARPPGGESLSDVASRVHNFLNMIFRDRAGEDVYVVTHGGTLRCLRFLLEKWTFEQALTWPEGNPPHNCGVTVYEYDPTVRKLLLKNYNTVHWK